MLLWNPTWPIVIIALDAGGRALMTRDMELIRKIVAEIRARDTTRPQTLDILDVDPAVLARHIELLHDAGLIEAIKSEPFNAPYPTIMVKDLSWAGHDFAAAIENEGVWSKIKQAFSAKELSALPLSVVKTVGIGLLEQLAKAKLGLP